MVASVAEMFVSITRLRIRRFWFLLPFFLWNERATRQIVRTKGFVVGATLMDRQRAFWTTSVWESEAAMKAYRGSGAHASAMPKLAGWCDEASIAHWQQPDSVLPSWEVAHERMVRDGRSSKVQRPSPNHERRVIPPPRTTMSRPLKRAI